MTTSIRVRSGPQPAICSITRWYWTPIVQFYRGRVERQSEAIAHADHSTFAAHVGWVGETGNWHWNPAASEPSAHTFLPMW
jgi:hypothetical protein